MLKRPGERALVKTGIYFLNVPNDIDIQVRSRSGLAYKHGVFVLNGIGTIDSDYRGELCVLLANLGNDLFTVAPGDRIAQLVFAHVVHPSFCADAEESTSTERGTGGFGSTGR